MKIIILVIYSLLMCVSFGGDCKLAGWCKLLEKADSKFVHKLHARLKGLDIEGPGTIRSSPRYTGGGGRVEEKILWAHQDCKLAYCEAGSVVGNNIGTKAADSFVDTMTHHKVVDAVDASTGKMVPYPKMGAGLGQVSKHIDDAQCEKMLSGWRRNLDDNTQANNLFTPKGYTSAHALRDCDDVFGLDLPGSKNLADGLAIDKNWGPTYQLNATASIHKRGEKLIALEVDVDSNSPNFDLKGVDALTNAKAYNIKLSNTALSSSIPNPAKRKIIIDAYKAAKAKNPAMKYVIVMPEAPDFSHVAISDFKDEFLAAGLSDVEFTNLFEKIDIRP
jgi:hypothetical protein